HVLVRLHAGVPDRRRARLPAAGEGQEATCPVAALEDVLAQGARAGSGTAVPPETLARQEFAHLSHKSSSHRASVSFAASVSCELLLDSSGRTQSHTFFKESHHGRPRHHLPSRRSEAWRPDSRR